MAAQSRRAADAQEGRIGALLDGFRDIRARSDISERTAASAIRDQFQSLITDYASATARHRQQQEGLADEFNLLEVLQLTGNEVRHSMALAWLLDGDMRRLGTHAQGSLGFRLFLEEFKLPLAYADHAYRVRREVPGEDSIVDIEIACRGKFLIHIENKIWSPEGADQTDREWRDLFRRSTSLGLDPEDKSRVHALFLSFILNSTGNAGGEQ
jgi:hypothetical protein